MHYDMHDPGGTPLLLLHRGLFDIHQQSSELLPGHSPEPSRSRYQPAASPLPSAKNQTLRAISPNILGQWGRLHLAQLEQNDAVDLRIGQEQVRVGGERASALRRQVGP